MKLTAYKNAVVARYKNKRTAAILNDGNILLEFVRLLDKDEDKLIPTCSYEIIRDKVVITNIKLSKEGAGVLMVILQKIIENDLSK